ncbi:MAG: ferrochelatase [Bacteroidales bacterium]
MIKKRKTALLLVNLGTPDRATKGSVFTYLTEFLNDGRVIDIPWLFRKILVNLIIIPFRLSNSTRIYKKLWTDEGSPLLLYLESLGKKLQNRLPENFWVYTAMRYRKPSLKHVLDEIRHESFDKLVIFPLFPQYASSTTGSIFEKVFREMADWQAMPELHFVGQYHHHPAFIQAFANLISSYDPEKYDHIIFSYHGLPERQMNKIHPGNPCNVCSCDLEMPEYGMLCYKATCYETTRLLAEKLKLPEDRYSVGFQSRLSKNWLRPFSDKLVEGYARAGMKKILVVAPSFVADCLETIVEIGEEYQHLFRQHGGRELTLVRSLNDNDAWVEAVAEIISGQRSRIPGYSEISRN